MVIDYKVFCCFLKFVHHWNNEITKRKMEEWKYRNNERIYLEYYFISFHLLKNTSHLSLVILFQLCKVCINIFEEDSMNICKNIVRGWKRGVTFPALFFTMFLPVCRQSLLSFLPFCYFYVARHVARTHDNSSFYRSTFKSSTRGWHVLNFCECYVGVSISSGTVFTRKPIIKSIIL